MSASPGVTQSKINTAGIRPAGSCSRFIQKMIPCGDSVRVRNLTSTPEPA